MPAVTTDNFNVTTDDGNYATVATKYVSSAHYAKNILYRSDGTEVVREQQLILTPGAPTPANSDIVNASNGAIASTDFAIRNTSVHSFFIPMLAWRDIEILISMDSTALDQALTCTLSSTRLIGATGSQNSRIQHASFTVPASTFPMQFGFVSTNGSLSPGGVTGADPSAVYAVYPAPLIKVASFLWLTLQASSLPTAGQIQAIAITRKVS